MDVLIGVGCDTEERARLARTLERDPHFLERWFSAAERAAIADALDPAGLTLRVFCLKEAAIKALWREHQLTPSAVEALPGPDGRFSLTFASPFPTPICLTCECGGDEVHAWAQVSAWRSGCSNSALPLGTQRRKDTK